MWTKSAIQMQIESIQERAKFASDINRLLENYRIDDGVFGISHGNTFELSKGYFVEEKSFEDMSTLIKEMNQSTQAVRIKEGKFILGNVYECLSDTPDEKSVFSIEFLEDVR